LFLLFENILEMIKFYCSWIKETNVNKLSRDSCNKIACVIRHGSSYLNSHCTHIVNFNITSA